jgi:hypothetical protein
MESNIKSSFIPQAPLSPMRAAGPSSRGGGFDLFILIGIVVFVASATLAAGVFLYSQYLSTSAASKLEQLERAKQAFEPSLIQDLTRLDSRMRAANTILEGHVAPTTLFHLLEQLTLQTVAFSAFDFSSSPDGLTLVMKGLAQSVNSIALQADLLAKSGVISNPIFSNINRQANGVNFDFTASVNASALNYAGLMSGGGAPMEEAQSQEPASPFGTPGDSQQPAQQQMQQQMPQQMQQPTGQMQQPLPPAGGQQAPGTGVPPDL